MLNLMTIVNKQKELDTKIHEKHNVSYEETFIHRKLALLVELGELANEVRSFKYWSLKSASAEHVILEEFVDCLHFTISLGISMDANFEEFEQTSESDQDLNLIFVELFSKVSNLNSNDLTAYFDGFNYLLHLANILGFTSEKIFDAYLLKNEVNHQRQKDNY